jgi:hypothetical protein
MARKIAEATTMTECQSCHAPIRWVRTEKGKRMPLDADPCPDGNIVLVDGVAHVMKQEELGDMFFRPGQRFKSHFATCAHAASHRRPVSSRGKTE